jgi:hypothetical protein
MTQPENSIRLNEILIEFEHLGDEIEEIQEEQTEPVIEYVLSECVASLSDAKVFLRRALSH